MKSILNLNWVSTGRLLFSHIELQRRREIYALLFVMVIVSILELLSIGSVMPLLAVLTNPERFLKIGYFEEVYSFLHIGSTREVMILFLGIFVATTLFAGIFRWQLLRMQVRLSYSIGIDFSVKVFKYALYLPYIEHAHLNSSEIISTIVQKISIVIDRVVFPALTIISCSMILTLMFIAALFSSATITVVVLTIFLFIYGVMIIFTKKILSRNSESISKTSHKVIQEVQEALGGIRDILIEGNQSIHIAQYRKLDEVLRDAQGSIQLISMGPRYLVEVLGMLTLAVIAYWATFSGEGLVAIIPALGLIALAIQRLLPMAQQLYNNWAYLKGSANVLQDVVQKLELTSEKEDVGVLKEGIRFENLIELENISFRYSPGEQNILSNISIKIRAGECIGFIGETGGGKTTLLDLVIGLLPPTTGKLLVDGVEIGKENIGSWMSNIAHVPQNIYLSDATILENIAFGIPAESIDLERVKWASEKAKIADLIESLELNYQTRVGENGVRLSGGQRQRIGIARALYRGGTILILDEATSALDELTECELMRSIEEIGADITLLIIAHRLSTLKKCNKIFEIRNGYITEKSKIS